MPAPESITFHSVEDMADIIDSYKRLSVKKHDDIIAILRDPSTDEVEKEVLIISVLTGLSEEEVFHLPLPEFTALSAKAKFLSKYPEDDYTKVRIADSYKVGEYTLIPCKDFRKVTTLQYVDFQEFAKDVEKNAVQLLSCLMIPKGHQYNEGYDIEDVQNSIREYLSVEDLLRLFAFFLNSFVQLILASRTSLAKLAKKEKDKEKRMKIETQLKKWEQMLQTITQASGDGLRM